nr:hypothetical protein [Bradyrhizobium sp. CCBAU 53380]
MIKKHYPHVEWVISFAGGCQCGNRTIYRASGFVLTGIKVNKSLLQTPDGSLTHKMTQMTGKNRADHFARTGGSWSVQGHTLRRLPDAARLFPRSGGAGAAGAEGNRLCRDRAAQRRDVSRDCAWEAGDVRAPSEQRRRSATPTLHHRQIDKKGPRNRPGLLSRDCSAVQGLDVRKVRLASPGKVRGAE